jgi:hypothetical protein
LASFLALLPRTLTTFLLALAALLRFYGNTDTDTEFLHLTTLGWSLVAFSLGSAALLANLGLEWNAGNRSRSQAEDARLRAARERVRAEEERVRAEEERIRAARERVRAEEERRRTREREARRDDLEDEERRQADRERNRAGEERNRAGEERERAARRARVQNRWIILQVQHQVAPGEATRTALGDFVAFLQEYGE